MSAFVFPGGHFWPPCVGGFFFCSGSAGNETATCALIETIRRASLAMLMPNRQLTLEL